MDYVVALELEEAKVPEADRQAGQGLREVLEGDIGK